MLPLDPGQPDGLLPAHVDAVLRPRRVEHLNAAEAGRGEHRLCLLDSPDRAKPGAAIGERHGHAVHQDGLPILPATSLANLKSIIRKVPSSSSAALMRASTV